MAVDTFRQIMEKIAPVTNNFLLSCAWEYTTHPSPHEHIGVLGEYCLPHTIIFSNGNILYDELLDAIISARINKYVFSINEATAETYAAVRKGGRFANVINNIKRMAQAKARAGHGPDLAVNMTLLRSNIEELPDFVAMAVALGIQNITGRHLILNKGLGMQEELVTDYDRADAIITKAGDLARKAGIPFEVPLYKTPKPTEKPCSAAWNQWHVSSNGDVSVCPRIHKYVQIGNIIRQSFEEIHEGDAAVALREEFRSRSFTNPVCALCLENKENEIEIDQGI